MRGESVSRLVLGVGLAPAEMARQLRASVGLSGQDGLLVRVVEEASPADCAGLAVGDLITAAGGASTTTVDDLHHALDAARTTRRLTLQVVRGDELRTVEVAFDD